MSSNGGILKFATNLPVEFAIAAPPEAAASQFSDEPEWKAKLVDGRVVYLKPRVLARIQELGIPYGEPVQVTKLERQNGQKKVFEWEVKRVYAPGQNVGTSQIAPATSSVVPKGNTNTTPARIANGQQLQATPEAPGQTTASTCPGGPGPTAQLLTNCFGAAIDALRAAQKIGADRGMELKFNEANIISVALSVYINKSKAGYQ